jgi:hypothetical protein
MNELETLQLARKALEDAIDWVSSMHPTTSRRARRTLYYEAATAVDALITERVHASLPVQRLRPRRELSQQCGLYSDHANCPGETTLGTERCACHCHEMQP